MPTYNSNDMPSYFNWNYTMPSVGPNGQLTGSPTPVGDHPDYSRGTDIHWSDDSWQHMDPHQDREGNYISPTIFMNDNLPGGHAAAFPDTDEYGHIGRVFRTDRNRAIGKIALLLAGGAALGNMGSAGAGGVGEVGEGFGISPDFLSTGAAGLEGAGAAIPAGIETMTVTAPALAGMTAGEIAGLSAAGVGAGALSSISPNGMPTGDPSSAPPGASQASGEYVAPESPPGGPLSNLSGEAGGGTEVGAGTPPGSPPGFFSKLGTYGKNLFTTPEGGVNWANVIKYGGTALGTLGSAANNSQNRPAPPPPAGWNDPLVPRPLNRQVVGLGNDDAYRNYGKSGGEHMFFQDAGAAPPPNNGGGPTMHLNDPRFGTEPVMRSGGHYIKGPGTGRSDEIDAKLSNDEYVMDAETVALLGDGSPEAGAKRLDQLRENIRKHKGQQLAKGKFSANAKDPGAYMPPMKKAKGGTVLRAVAKPAVDDSIRAAQLAAVQRFRDAIKNQVPATPVVEPLKKAKGGAVKAMNDFATAMEREVMSGNAGRVEQLKSQMDGLTPGAGKFFVDGFAKGGKVSSLLESFGKFFNPPLEATMPPKMQLSPEDMAWMVQWLRTHNPNSDALKHFELATTPDLRGVQRPPVAAPPDDVLKMLGQE